MHLKIKIILILSICFFHVSAQKVDSDTLINSMKLGITNFFINQRLLRSDEVNGNFKSVFATEIKEQKTLGYNINGIYRIGVFQSHSGQHILIKENLVFKIFDVTEIDLVLKEVIDYSMRNNITSDAMLFYIKAIIEVYDENYKGTQGGGRLRN